MASEKPAIAQKVAARDGGWFCHYCGTPLLPFGEPDSTCTIDHKFPRSKGGRRYAVGNCVLACKSCNEEKADTPYHKYLFLWRQRREAQAMEQHLYMVSFDGWTAHWMDGGYTERDTLFVAAATEQEARPIAVKNSRYLDDESEMEFVDLGLTDKPSGYCTDDWGILTEAHYDIIVASMPQDESEAS